MSLEKFEKFKLWNVFSIGRELYELILIFA